MADIDKKISAFNVGVVNASSFFLQANNGESTKVSGAQIADYSATSKNYAGLNTTSKTLVDAINEMYAAGTGSFIIVQTLPSEDIDTKSIYLVPKTPPQTSNGYDEYLYVNNAWEKIGDTAIDLSGYATLQDLAAIIDDTATDTDTTWSSQAIATNFVDNTTMTETVATLNTAINKKAEIDDGDVNNSETWSSAKLKAMFELFFPTVNIFGFHINGSATDPSDAVTYLAGAVGMHPAHMDYTNSVFDYGSWENAFFMPKPCFLKRDGTVDFYLDPDDYTKRADGTPSHIDHLMNIELSSTTSKGYVIDDYMVYNDQLYIVTTGIESGASIVTSGENANVAVVLNAPTDVYGNAMMEWGQNGKKIWYKIVPDSGDATSATVYIADMQVDNGYKCWSFYDKNNTLKDHFYTAIYNSMYSRYAPFDPSSAVNKKDNLRSVSCASWTNDILLLSCNTIEESLTRLGLNNQGTDTGWYFDTYADTVLINLLLILMGKSLDFESVYGKPHYTTSLSSSGLQPLISGTLDDKGMFYGYNSVSGGCKIFGMENFYGNMGRIIAGLVVDHNNSTSSERENWRWKYKLTRGTVDSSGASDYNLNGTNFLVASSIGLTPSGTITSMTYNANGSIIVSSVRNSVDPGIYNTEITHSTGSAKYFAVRGGVNMNSYAYIRGTSNTWDLSLSSSTTGTTLANTCLTYR